MSNLYEHSETELQAIKQLEIRFKDSLTLRLKEHPVLFYRFLKARNFDVDKAEIMLRNHIAWRKAFQVDTILDTFKPKEVFLKYTSSSLIGRDKEGNVVKYAPSGRLHPRDVEKSVILNNYVKHWIWLIEKVTQHTQEENVKTGSKAYQAVLIIDLKGITLAKVACKFSTEFFIRLTHLLQDNYPESMKNMYIINAPAYITIIFSIVKKVMSNEMIQKIHVFGDSGWKEILLNAIDADVLPVFLGGNRTDPDGNPLCKSFVIQEDQIPEKYFIKDEERRFKDLSQVQKVVIPQGSKHKILMKVEEYGSIIRWEFEVKAKDIGFGLFLYKNNDELVEVLPIQPFITSDGVEREYFKTNAKGTYCIVFENSHTWSSKDVVYCVKVEKPDVQDIQIPFS